MKNNFIAEPDEKELLRLSELNRYENDLYKKGCKLIAGVDEVGRGPLAGPVLACAVVLPQNCLIPGINDSKKLSEKKRESLFLTIQSLALEISFGWVEEKTIDEINILNATHLAMRTSIAGLKTEIDAVLIDGLPVPDITVPQTAILKGDQKSISIAAASIVAKVSRDRLMYEYDRKFPCYDFKNNKGYGTKTHISAILEHGICEIHRLSFLKKLRGKP